MFNKNVSKQEFDSFADSQDWFNQWLVKKIKSLEARLETLEKKQSPLSNAKLHSSFGQNTQSLGQALKRVDSPVPKRITQFTITRIPCCKAKGKR